MKGSKVEFNSTARARFALLRAFLLLALALACVPNVAYATEDMGGGFSGSGGGDFWQNLRQNFDFENTDWYIGSVWDSVFGGGGGHAFSGNTSDNTSDTSSASDTAPVLEDSFYYIDGGVYTGAPVSSDVSGIDFAGICFSESKYNQLTSVLNEHADWYYWMSVGGDKNNNTSGVLVLTDKKPTIGYDNKPYGFVLPTDYNGTYPIWNYSLVGNDSKYKVRNGKYYINLSGVAQFYYPSGTISGGDKNGVANSTWFYYYGRLDGRSYSLDGDSGTTDAPTEPSYPSDNPDYPTPTTYTEPDTTLPTIGDQTETTVDLSPVTDRQDITNTLLYGVGSDLGNMYNMVWTEFDQLEREVYDLGDMLTDYLRTDTALLAAIGYTLDDIHTAMGNLDQDTDAIDLSGITSRLDDVISSLANVTSYDDTSLIAAVNNAAYDDTNLLTTIDNAAYDDTGLIAAITGSGGSDLLGLFGRLDVILNWLDDYTGFDDSDLLVLVENIYDALHNLQDEDTAVTTIRGDVRLIADRLAAVLQDFDNLLLVLEDWPDYPSVPDISVLRDIYDELVDLGNNLVGFWGAVEDSLDSILREIQALPHEDVEYPFEPWPTEPDGGPIIGPIDVDPYGYPMMPDWELYKEPLNIPALQHAIDELMTKFPFSMLNQLVQIAMYIKRDPVAPVFDLPMPNPSDWSAPYSVHVDLSDLDMMAAVLRLGITVWAIARISTKTVKMWMGDKAVE